MKQIGIASAACLASVVVFGLVSAAFAGTVETVTLNGTTYECPAEDTTIIALMVTSGRWAKKLGDVPRELETKPE